MKLNIFFLFLGFWLSSMVTEPSWAEFRVGSGTHTATGGRNIPVLYGAWQGPSWGVSALSVGVQNDLSYYSSYQLNVVFRLLKPKNLFWGRTEAALGWGAIYNQYGTQLAAGAELKKDSSFTTGPTVRALWYFVDPVYIGFEVMFGMTDPFMSLFTLTTQDTSVFLLGVSI